MYCVVVEVLVSCNQHANASEGGADGAATQPACSFDCLCVVGTDRLWSLVMEGWSHRHTEERRHREDAAHLIKRTYSASLQNHYLNERFTGIHGQGCGIVAPKKHSLANAQLL